MHPIGAAIVALVGGAASSAFAIFHGAGNGILTIARGTLPLAIFGPHNYGYRLGIIGAPARMAQAAAPLAFGLLIDSMGSRILIVSSALSLSALLALFVPSNPAPFQAKPQHGKRDRPGNWHPRFCAMGDHAAAILCGLSRLSFPGCRTVVLCGDAEAEEGGRHGSSAYVRTALLAIRISERALAAASASGVA
jgi:MFS family permease